MRVRAPICPRHHGTIFLLQREFTSSVWQNKDFPDRFSFFQLYDRDFCFLVKDSGSEAEVVVIQARDRGLGRKVREALISVSEYSMLGGVKQRGDHGRIRRGGIGESEAQTDECTKA